MRTQDIPDLSAEFSDVRFGDERLKSRLLRIASSVAAAPSDSFPQLCGSDSELEGVYRFFSNARVTSESILTPHRGAALKRGGEGDILVLHDTTGFAFRGGSARKGLGRLQRSGRTQSRQGFFGHFAFAVAADGSRQPLGLIGLNTFVRDEAPVGPTTGRLTSKRKHKEALRWVALAEDVHSFKQNAIHVMDREADSYENHQRLLACGIRFVIRGRIGWARVGERKGVQDTLPELAAQTPIRLTREVLVSRRAPNSVGALNKNHPPRKERRAKLTVRAARVQIRRPHYLGRRNSDDSPIALNVVCVEEVNPPRGEESVSWMLLTNERIGTRQEIERIVDAYRARWMIEEFFKALKTGCAFEKRQLESLAALRNALAVFSVVAWRLLLLRSVARATPTRPAEAVATQRQLRLLRALPEIAPRFADVIVPARATASDVLQAIAKLGGHLKSNGPPGWQVIGRGYDSLLLLELGWMAREIS
jgi:hypothetical protein